MTKSFYHLSVIIPGVLILQYHGIEFWIQTVGLLTGASWSILIEIISFWCWFQREVFQSWRWWLVKTLAILATLLLLTGPLYIISEELIISVSSTSFAESDYEAKKTRLLNRIKSLEKSKRVFLGKLEFDNTDKMTKYNYVLAERDLRRANKQLDNLKRPTEGQKLPFQAVLIVLMQLLAVFITQTVVVLAIVKIAANYGEQAPSEPHSPPEDKRMKELRQLIMQRKKTGVDLEDFYKLTPDVLRKIFNYPTLIKQGAKPFADHVIGEIYKHVTTLEGKQDVG